MPDTVAVAELYGPVIQGEGYVQGHRSMFLRLALCDGSDGGGKKSWCSWCDSMNAVDPANRGTWRRMTQDEIVAELQAKAPYCKTVTITGGNPVIHELSIVVSELKKAGYRIFVETQGTVFRSWLWWADVITVSPKPPSAGYWLPADTLEAFLHSVDSGQIIGRQKPSVVLKVVVDPDEQFDYGFASEIARKYGEKHPIQFLCRTKAADDTGDLLARYAHLQRLVCSDATLHDSVRIGMQEHVALYGHKTGI